MDSSWGVTGLAEALPTEALPTEAATSVDVPSNPDPSTEVSAPTVDPQDYGWATPIGYDYKKYNMSTADAKAAFEAAAAENVASGIGATLHSGEGWLGNAPIYEWKEEYGEIGPRFADLEAMLFGTEENASNAATTVVNFEGITKIEVVQEGSVRIEPIRTFEEGGLHPAMLENVKLARYKIPTPIQQFCLPAIFKGYDVIASAQTGSGKTAAFLIPIFSKLMGKAKRLAANRPNPSQHDPTIHGQIRAEPLVLIVCPTRELATQIFDEARKLAYRTMLRPAVVYGGGPLRDQMIQLGKGADILIGTPGRLIDFMNRPQILSFQRLKYMVIDEADEMMHADWEAELKSIMTGGDQEEGNITYLMFSATFPKSIRNLAKEYLREDHVRIRVGRIGSSHENIKQDIVYVAPEVKRKALHDLLMSHPPARTIVFVNSKRAADEVDDFLFNLSLPCTSIHADRTQREREDSIRAFRAGKAPILIATGVTARGIDVMNVQHVINFDLPSTQHGGIEEYTHRIGRTGRAGRVGLATSFYNERDSDLAESLVKTLLETHQVIPDFLESHIPEGFTADGQGDIDKLHFDADSDGENGDDNGEPAAAWGGDAGAETSTGGGDSSAPEVVAPVAANPGLNAVAPGLNAAAPALNAAAPALNAAAPAFNAAAPALNAAAPAFHAAPAPGVAPAINAAPATDTGPAINVPAALAVHSDWSTPAPGGNPDWPTPAPGGNNPQPWASTGGGW